MLPTATVRSVFSRVLDEDHDSVQAVATSSDERVPPSNIRILADMRQWAYDLDFLISRQPRHGASKICFTDAAPCVQ